MTSFEKCPKCGKEAFELVDTAYDLEAEFDEGFPTRKDTYVCHHCGFEESQRICE